MSNHSRLSPENIKDPLIRSRLYKELKDGRPDWDEWEISLDEIKQPELISLRYYGTAEHKKVVSVCAGLDDLRAHLDAGTVIRLPPVTWLRERIRHYCGMECSNS